MTKADTPITSPESLGKQTVILANDQTGKFVNAGTSANEDMQISSETADRFTYLQFVKQGTFWKIWCLKYQSFCSGFGAGYPIKPKVADEQWSHFEVQMDLDYAITIKSFVKENPGPYVALPSNWQTGAHDNRFRICEATRIIGRGTFHAYTFSQSLEKFDPEEFRWIENNSYAK